MAAKDIEAFIEKLTVGDDARLPNGATEEQITRFETECEVKLPSLFREWLLRSDGGDLFPPAGFQIYGIAHKPFIDINDDDRPDERYIVIGALASGDPVLCEKENERISIFNHDAGRIEEDEVYPDFLAFLNDLPSLLGLEE